MKFKYLRWINNNELLCYSMLNTMKWDFLSFHNCFPVFHCMIIRNEATNYSKIERLACLQWFPLSSSFLGFLCVILESRDWKRVKNSHFSTHYCTLSFEFTFYSLSSEIFLHFSTSIWVVCDAIFIFNIASRLNTKSRHLDAVEKCKREEKMKRFKAKANEVIAFVVITNFIVVLSCVGWAASYFSRFKRCWLSGWRFCWVVADSTSNSCV